MFDIITASRTCLVVDVGIQISKMAGTPYYSEAHRQTPTFKEVINALECEKEEEGYSK